MHGICGSPGPWVAVHCPGDAPGRLRYIKRVGYFSSIAKVELPQLSEYEIDGGPKVCWDKCTQIMNANACLISAAPELRDAAIEGIAALYGAIEVCGDIGNLSHALRMLESAVRKSEPTRPDLLAVEE